MTMVNVIVMVNVVLKGDGECVIVNDNYNDIHDSASAPRLPSHSRSRSLDAGREAMLWIFGWRYNVHYI